MTPWTAACQAPLSMIFPKQEYWNGLPFPSPEDLPDPGIEPKSPALTDGSFTAKSPGKPMYVCTGMCVGVCLYIYINNIAMIY